MMGVGRVALGMLLKLSSVMGPEQSWANPGAWGPWFGSLQSSTSVFIGVSSVNCSVVSDSLWPHGLEPTRLLCSWDSPSKNTGVGRHSLLQGISRPRDRTQISCNVGRFITVWATRKAHFYRWGNKFRVWELESSALSTTPRWSPTRRSISFPRLWMFCPGPVMHSERAQNWGSDIPGSEGWLYTSLPCTLGRLLNCTELPLHLPSRDTVHILDLSHAQKCLVYDLGSVYVSALFQASNWIFE